MAIETNNRFTLFFLGGGVSIPLAASGSAGDQVVLYIEALEDVEIEPSQLSAAIASPSSVSEINIQVQRYFNPTLDGVTPGTSLEAINPNKLGETPPQALIIKLDASFSDNGTLIPELSSGVVAATSTINAEERGIPYTLWKGERMRVVYKNNPSKAVTLFFRAAWSLK